MGRKQRDDGEGSVYQVHAKDCARPTKAGKPACKCPWRAAFVRGYIDGKAQRKTFSAPTRSAALIRLRDYREDAEAAYLPTGRSVTVKEWLNYCHARLLPKHQRPSSLVRTRGVMDNYLIPLLGHLRLDKLNADHIEDAWELLAETGNPLLVDNARPLSPATIHGAHTVLSRCLRLAMQKKRIRVNPAGPDSMSAPSAGDSKAKPLETRDWQAVLEVAAHVPNTARWSVALAIGLRQGETLALRWSDVDLDDGTLRVTQTVYRLPGKGLVVGPPKTDRSERPVALPGELVDQLRAHRTQQLEHRLRVGDHWTDNDLVFPMEDGTYFDASVDRRRWKKLLVAAGVAPIKLHAARHTAATVMLLQGIDPRVVMEIMGWSQIQTAASYQHAVQEAQRAAMEKVGRAMLSGL